MSTALAQMVERFEQGLNRNAKGDCRIGAELKFPLVNLDGSAVSRDVVAALWTYLADEGWPLVHDPLSGEAVGARRPGPRNDTVASCETGYCKTEFSLAHVANLHELDGAVRELKALLAPFSERQRVRFIAHGIHPVTHPTRQLLMNKLRTSVWDKVFPSNHVIPADEGDDVHMFTVNAASHVHISLPPDQVIPAVNVLNGFAGAQIALTAHSSVWKGGVDQAHRCVAERLWDWWPPAQGRAGVPEAPFEDCRDYVTTIGKFKPVYVMRDGRPVTLKRYAHFLEYFSQEIAHGEELNGTEVEVTPQAADIGAHNSCYWFCARVSRYYTVENRTTDQQPPEALVAPAALTLGLLSALDEAREVIASHNWQTLRQARVTACARPDGAALGASQAFVTHLAGEMLDVARTGLDRRGLGEVDYLAPLQENWNGQTSPATAAERIFKYDGIGALVEARNLCRKERVA